MIKQVIQINVFFFFKFKEIVQGCKKQLKDNDKTREQRQSQHEHNISKITSRKIAK